MRIELEEMLIDEPIVNTNEPISFTVDLQPLLASDQLI